MKRIFLLIILLSLPWAAKSSNRPVLSLLTCDSGGELYSTFGHSALRVYYPETGQDLVFNFGLFDFGTPNFYWKFMRGKLQYMLGIQYMEDFMAQYRYEGRQVKEQVLSLDSSQTSAIVERLQFLHLPANRYYYYSFLYKNCTSELRDLIFPLVQAEVERFKGISAGVTDRDLINDYITGWTKFGISLILGSGLDKEISVYQSMFLPQNLFRGIRSMDNGGKPMVEKEHVLYDSATESEKSSFTAVVVSPLFVLSLLLAGVLAGFFAKRFGKAFSNGYLVVISLLGVVLGGIILITEHRELYMNYNLLWCNPLFGLVATASFKGWKKTERMLSALSLVLLSILQLIWALDVQYAHPGFVVIVLTLALIFLSRIFARPATKEPAQKQMSYGSR